MSDGDTIFALSSGAGAAGVAVIRLSGPHVRFGLETLVDSIPEPRRASLRSIRSPDGELIDRGLVIFFPAPGSFTGEDVAELHVHGGRAVVAALLRGLEQITGFRAAEAGEFTRRAFLNRRLDLTQVEGLADLIYAETEAQRLQALRQADGSLRNLYVGWRERLVRGRALIEAELDFPEEEDVPGSVSVQVWDGLRALEKEIANHLSDRRGERLREGAEIVVLGPPNAGKSSLINALAKRDVAIVTPEPGTTRDLIEVRLDLDGYPVTVIDTAGLREATGAVEREGIRRAEQRAANADLVLWLTDVTESGVAPASASFTVGTKIDLIDSAPERSRLSGQYVHLVSARTGEGMPELLASLALVVRERLQPPESPLLTRSRHRAALLECSEALGRAIRSDGPIELRADDLRRAGDALGRITGHTGVEDLLDVIFREFCIGK